MTLLLPDSQEARRVMNRVVIHAATTGVVPAHKGATNVPAMQALARALANPARLAQRQAENAEMAATHVATNQPAPVSLIR